MCIQRWSGPSRGTIDRTRSRCGVLQSNVTGLFVGSVRRSSVGSDVRSLKTTPMWSSF